MTSHLCQLSHSNTWPLQYTANMASMVSLSATSPLLLSTSRLILNRLVSITAINVSISFTLSTRAPALSADHQSCNHTKLILSMSAQCFDLLRSSLHSSRTVFLLCCPSSFSHSTYLPCDKSPFACQDRRLSKDLSLCLNDPKRFLPITSDL